MKRRLIALLCAGIISGTLTGCDVIETSDTHLDTYNIEFNSIAKDVNIIINSNNGYTLHKGDFYMGMHGYGTAGKYAGINKMDFDCGQEIVSNHEFSIHAETPNEEEYDNICEGCFGKQ